MKRTFIAGVVGCVAGAAAIMAIGAGQPQGGPATAAELAPAGEDEWCVAHLEHGELGLDASTRHSSYNGRIRSRNHLAVQAEGRFMSLHAGWLRLACESGGEVWIPEHAIRAVELMSEKSFQWRNGPPPGWSPEQDE